MIDWDEISKAKSTDELRDIKLWLFQENIRLENEKRELALSQEKFVNERVRLRQELDELNRKTLDGFKHLDEDRRSLEQQKKALAAEKLSVAKQEWHGQASEEAIRLLFRGTNNALTLRKRYRDLVKIFHPDNLCGDEELVQMINREYLRRKGD